MGGAQLAQEEGRGLGGARLGYLHLVNLAGLQADRGIVGHLFSQARARRIDQRWLPFEHPDAPQVRIRQEVRFVHEEDCRTDFCGLLA